MQDTTAEATSWWQRLIYLLLQLAGFIVLLVIHILILEQLARLFFPASESDMEISSLIIIWGTGLIAVLNSAYLLDYFQQRYGFAGLGFTSRNLKYGISTGLLVGAGIITTGFLMLLAGGWVTISSIDFQPNLLLAWLFFFLIQPLTEEIIMRSVLQTQVHRYFGRQAGLIITALVFAGMHAGNDAFSWVAGFEIFLGGYLMGQLYLKAQNIWAPFLMHASWNFVQSTVLGFAVSGMDTYRLLHLNIDGPEWLTGGTFGLEASWLTIMMIVLAIIYFWDTPDVTPWLREESERLNNEPIAMETTGIGPFYEEKGLE
jgi:membrane protease YdiL (CAAX protease family)